MKRYRNIKLDSDINEDDELMFDDFDDFDDYEEEIRWTKKMKSKKLR